MLASTDDAHVFISYATPDRERALDVAATLEANGLTVWIDRHGIPGGTDWAAQIARAVRSCRVVAVICSAASVSSRNVQQELQLAWHHGKPILPLLLEPVEFPDAVAYFLQGRQWIDLSAFISDEWLNVVFRALDGSGTEPKRPPVTAGRPFVQAGNLPVPATPLVGRDDIIEQIVALLTREDVRLVSLTGPGGVGKTRLAIEVAARLVPDFADGVWFVRLAPLRDPALVISTIAQTLGIRDEGNDSQTERLHRYLRTRRLLLVIDNVEHVIDFAPELAELLAHGADVKILATGRTTLHLTGEIELIVDPLSTPPTPDGLLSANEADSFASVRLFVQRAEAAKPEFRLSDENAGVVAAICTRLDGLPLAIEIAAARIKLIPLEGLFARLEKRLPVLTGGARDLPERQQTLRRTIAWSFDLLSVAEQRLFRQLGVFAGGCTFEAAEAVAGSNLEIETFDGLASLVEKSLLRLDESGHEPRLRMLETIREFAIEELIRNSEEAIARRAHADWCLRLAEQAYDVCVRGAVQPVWVNRVAADDANMQLALGWLEHTSDLDSWLRLAATLAPMWLLGGRPTLADEWLVRGLARAEGVSPSTRARALYWGGSRALDRGELEDAFSHGELCGQIYADLGDVWGVGVANKLLASTHWIAGKYEHAGRLFEHALRAFEQTASADWEALTLVNIGEMALDQGQFEQAEIRLRKGLGISRRLKDPWGVVTALNPLGIVATEQGDFDIAAAHLLDGLATWQVLGAESTEFARWLEAIGLLAERTGATDLAVHLFGAAAKHRDRSGDAHLRGGRSRFDLAIEHIQATIGESDYRSLFAEGQAMAIVDTIEHANLVLTGCLAAESR